MTVRYQDVVCAFIVDQKSIETTFSSSQFRILCSQRYDDAEHFPSMFEFPGGKVDEGENHLDTMERECFEELGIKVDTINSQRLENGMKITDITLQPCYSFNHAPKEDKRLGGLITFRLFFYWAKIVDSSKPRPLASQKLVWLTPEEMAKLTFCPGDEGIIQDMISGTLRPPH